jgi:hypothetical protein
MTSVASYEGPNKRSYISISSFNNDFFVYTSVIDATKRRIYSLRVNPDANASNCPVGRVLIENGRKLFAGTNDAVTTYMVGVFDPVSFLSGFIDPNSPVYAVYNTDLPSFIPRGVDPGPGGLVDNGPPVLTNSSVDAKTYIHAGTNVQAGTYMQAGTYISSGTYMQAGTYVSTGTGLISATGQNRVGVITNYPVSTNTATINLNVGASQVHQVTFTGANAGGWTASLNATSNGTSSDLSSLIGSMLYIIIVNSGTGGGSVSIVLGNQMRELNINGSGGGTGAQNIVVPQASGNYANHDLCMRRYKYA